MILIGLAGGKEEAREQVARRLEKAGQHIKAFAILGSRTGDGRARTLERALEGFERGGKLGGLVFTHLLTEAEADALRERGGHVWHLADPVSGVVPIRRGEPLVTLTAGGDRHLLCPLQALSDVLLCRAHGGRR